MRGTLGLAALLAVIGCNAPDESAIAETSGALATSVASTDDGVASESSGDAPTPSTDDDGSTSGDATTGAPDDPSGCDPSDDAPEPEPAEPIDWVGVQYDYGGATTPISGHVDEIDAIADSITARAAQVLDEIAARRAMLPYGGIAPDACAADELVVYAAPDGIAASDRYTVTVEQGTQSESSFVYRILARKPDSNRELDTSWTSFSFAGTVTVHVTTTEPGVTGCIVRPGAAAIETSFADGTCTFTLDRPGNFSVELAPNIHNPILHPMLVFANPLEVDVPDANDPDVRWLGPGVHDLGAGQPIASGQTIYIAGGAWVNGAFLASGAVTDVAIKGRGVISGLFMDTGDQELNKDVPGMIDIPYMGSENVLIEGVTLVDGPRFNIRALASHTTVKNVKVMSWWFSTDGVVGGTGSLIEDNFIKVNDDSIKLHWGDTIARRNVLWQLENGGTFNLSWNIHDDVHDFHVYDNDVIHAEHYDIEATAVFRSRHAGSGTLSRYLFENIRVENANWRLFYLVIENNKWFEPSLGYGEIEQVVFRNIHAQSLEHQRPNVVQGIDGNHKVKNVAFQNVFTDGLCIGSANGGDFAIDPDTTNAIRIMKAADGTCG